MAFEITDLMIQVVTDSAHAAGEKDQPTRCLPDVTCVGRQPATACKADHTCQQTRTTCEESVTCGDRPVRTKCQIGVSCRQSEASPAETELHALLAQLRATLAAETVTV